jgi:uncharacterized protein
METRTQHTSAGFAELTGNDYLSIPRIGEDGSLYGVNVLHAEAAALLEWAGPDDGTPLFQPAAGVSGPAVPLTGLRWRRLDRWIPTFAAELPGGVRLTGTICAPTGYPAARGFLVRFDLEHGGRAAVEVTVALHVRWGRSRHWIVTDRPLPGRNRMRADRARQSLSLETDGGRGPALAVVGSDGLVVDATWLDQPDTASADVMAPAAAGSTIEADHGEPLGATLSQTVAVVPNRRTTLSFFVGAGREPDGARAAATALRRTGADPWIRQARLELSHTLRAAQDHRWADMLNRNLLFNRYFAVGRAIDDDHLYLVRSRSTLCPAPAVFNEREALLWTLPALIIADPALAREALFRVLETFSERSGEHLRYLDGGAFDPAFSLEQFLLYAWAIDHYVAAAQDPTPLDEPLVQQVLAELDAALYMRLHPEHMLCATELLPSGDAADYPYTTLGNTMLWAYAQALPRIWQRHNGAEEPPPRFEGTGSEIAAAIWQHCVTVIDGEHVLTSSTDTEGGAAVYDDPEGSLALLPFFGFCAPDDPVWSATMEFLRSTRYPLWRGGPVAGIAHRADPGRARLAALVSDLLGPGSSDALDRLLKLALPAGVAAAAYDPATGEPTEPHHAAAAGFLAWALVRAAEAPSASVARKRRGR